ncbi:MAG: hypothetical protein ACM30E_05815 [Nitrososphaerales archaeon]
MIFHTYLTAYFFWLALALGCLSILMVHNLAGGYWGAVIRRPLEAAATTLPLLAVLFIPIVIGMPALYPWVHGNFAVSPAPAIPGAMLGFKQAYLNTPAFIIRAVVYFVIWIGLMLLLVRWSRERDSDPTPALTARLRNLSAIGLVLVSLSVSFAGIDWLMSLDPAWTSSIWGLIVATGALLSGFAFATLIVTLRANRPPFAEVTSPALFNSLGSLMLAFLMLWAYMSISQVILFYAGNLPEETIWYVRRTAGGWTLAALAVAVLGFIIPFSFLIIRGAKRNPRILAAVCVVILASQFLHWYWVVQPTFNSNTFIAAIMTVVLGAIIGGLWLVVFAWQFGKAPEVSPVEPKLIAAREEHEAALAERAHEEQAYADRVRAERAHD